MVDRTGQQLGSYRLIRLLGRGGFAEVYLGQHVWLNNLAAVKVLNGTLTKSDAEGFQREAYTIVRLIHPHIIRVFDYAIADGVPFLIMDYAPNGTLRNLCPKGRRVPPTDIVTYVKQVADALQYAHREKVIHRDVKPENMLLGRNDEVLLSDFGIATMSQSSRYQPTQDVVGTVAYMAPEQIQGKPHPASDQYALAIVVYEWLSGGCPFHGSFTEIAVQHIVAPPRPLREKVPDISPGIEQVMLIALAKDPHQRFASVQAFANALEQASTSGPSYQIVPAPTSLSSTTFVPSPVIEALPTQNPTIPVSEGGLTVDASQTHNTSPSTSSPFAISTFPQWARTLSRRSVLAGMTGLIVIGGGIAALTFTHYLSDKPPLITSPPHFTKVTRVPTTQRTEPPFKGSWSRLPSLPSPKADNVAIYVRLQQRDYIYMTGGYRGRDYAPGNDDTLYRYDIAAAQWKIVTSQFPGMYNNAVVQDRQGNLFFTGGYSPDSGIVTSLLYRYQPDTESLQKIAAPGWIPFGYGGSMVADQQDNLYLTQGFMQVVYSYTSAGTGWYCYNIVSGTWRRLASLPGVGVAYAVLAADGQGGIVLLGGVTDTEQNHGTDAIYRYHIASDRWTAEQVTAPQAFNGASSCAIGNGQVVVVGGYDPVQQITLNNAWLIDLKTLQSRPLASLPGGGSRLGAAAYDGVGNVYVVRGIISDPDQPSQDFWQLRLKR